MRVLSSLLQEANLITLLIKNRLQLRVRFISSDLNEIQFKDPITFNYYYEQIKNDFILYVAPSIHDINLIPNLLDLGCLEMRYFFSFLSFHYYIISLLL